MTPKSSKKAYFIALLFGSALATHLSIFFVKPWVASQKRKDSSNRSEDLKTKS